MCRAAGLVKLCVCREGKGEIRAVWRMSGLIVDELLLARQWHLCDEGIDALDIRRDSRLPELRCIKRIVGHDRGKKAPQPHELMRFKGFARCDGLRHLSGGPDCQTRQ